MSEQQRNKDGVVQLVDAVVPADQGLSSLGLLMQLAGNVFAAGAGMLGFMVLTASRGRGDSLWLLLLIGLSIARSLMHRTAGSHLLYGAGELRDGKALRVRGIRNYAVVALAQTAIVAAILL